jgi:hypothetical protein
MNETEWLACADPTPMLNFLRGRASGRKLRLFGCACLRKIWYLVTDGRSRTAVEVTERYADGLAGKIEMEMSQTEARAAIPVVGTRRQFTAGTRPWRDAQVFMALPENARFVLEKVNMLSSLGVAQDAPEEEAACPRAYCITPLAWSATDTFARSSARVR